LYEPGPGDPCLLGDGVEGDRDPGFVHAAQGGDGENQQLREALALALGERRTADVLGNTHDTPRKKSNTLIGPC
jgi:hypothetical protein